MLVTISKFYFGYHTSCDTSFTTTPLKNMVRTYFISDVDTVLHPKEIHLINSTYPLNPLSQVNDIRKWDIVAIRRFLG